MHFVGVCQYFVISVCFRVIHKNCAVFSAVWFGILEKTNARFQQVATQTIIRKNGKEMHFSISASENSTLLTQNLPEKFCKNASAEVEQIMAEAVK